jgi:UDP-N-acetyl-D-glucosamine dehydrogenase
MRFEPGRDGGHCLPVDPFYSPGARQFHTSTEFIELAGKVNQYMPYHCAERIEQALNDVSKPFKGSRILILGASYKGGVGDIGESPPCASSKVLTSRGGIVSYHDEYLPSLPGVGLEKVPLDDAVGEAGVVLLVTAHPELDYADVAARSVLFVDLRGVTRGQRVDNAVRL